MNFLFFLPTPLYRIWEIFDMSKKIKDVCIIFVYIFEYEISFARAVFYKIKTERLWLVEVVQRLLTSLYYCHGKSWIFDTIFPFPFSRHAVRRAETDLLPSATMTSGPLYERYAVAQMDFRRFRLCSPSTLVVHTTTPTDVIASGLLTHIIFHRIRAGLRGVVPRMSDECNDNCRSSFNISMFHFCFNNQ